MNSFQSNLHQRALEISKAFRKNESDLIETLFQIDEANVFLVLGYPSLFSYAVEALKLSEGNAYAFSSVARKSKQIPELKEEIKNGNLSVSKAKRIVSVITPENKSEWIKRAVALPKATLEKEVVKANPEAEKKESLRMISEDRFSMKLGISENLLKKVKRVQMLLMQRKKMNLSLEETLQIMTEEFLWKNDPVQKAKRAQSRSKTLGSGINSSHPSVRITVRKSINKRARLPAALKHSIFQRDQGVCQFQAQGEASGEKCGGMAYIEIHHKFPVSKGGLNTLENLITLCHKHHHYRHELGV